MSYTEKSSGKERPLRGGVVHCLSLAYFLVGRGVEVRSMMEVQEEGPG